MEFKKQAQSIECEIQAKVTDGGLDLRMTGHPAALKAALSVMLNEIARQEEVTLHELCDEIVDADFDKKHSDEVDEDIEEEIKTLSEDVKKLRLKLKEAKDNNFPNFILNVTEHIINDLLKRIEYLKSEMPDKKAPCSCSNCKEGSQAK